jgi:hypothetical protein
MHSARPVASTPLHSFIVAAFTNCAIYFTEARWALVEEFELYRGLDAEA